MELISDYEISKIIKRSYSDTKTFMYSQKIRVKKRDAQHTYYNKADVDRKIESWKVMFSPDLISLRDAPVYLGIPVAKFKEAVKEFGVDPEVTLGNKFYYSQKKLYAMYRRMNNISNVAHDYGMRKYCDYLENNRTNLSPIEKENISKKIGLKPELSYLVGAT